MKRRKRIYIVLLTLLMAVIPLTTGCANQEQPTGGTFLFSELVNIDNVEQVVVTTPYLSAPNVLSGKANLKQYFEDCFSDIYFTDEEDVETVSTEVMEAGTHRIDVQIKCKKQDAITLYVSTEGFGVLYVGDKVYVALRSCPLDWETIFHCNYYGVE